MQCGLPFMAIKWGTHGMSDAWIARNAMCFAFFMALSWRKHCILGIWIAWHAMRAAFFYCSKIEKGLHFRHMERALVHHGFEPWLRTKEHHSFESWFAIASSHWFPTMNLYEAQCVLSFMAFKCRRHCIFDMRCARNAMLSMLCCKCN